jgi:3-oxoacyl-[acyl-carrier protein] reductase
VDGLSTESRGSKVALVTGGAGGVGRGISEALADAGFDVLVAARDQARGESTVASITGRGRRCLFVPTDVRLEADVCRAIDAAQERFGGLDAIVHNATSRWSSEVLGPEDASGEVWDDHVGVALDAAFLLAHHGFAPLRDRGGSMLVLTSTTGIEGNATLPLYATVKGGQRGFVKALAREWGPHGVRVNALTPLARTPAMVAAERNDPSLGAKNRSRTVLGWVGDPQLDIGPAAAFLVGPDARYITGQNLFVNGGAYMGG